MGLGINYYRFFQKYYFLKALFFFAASMFSPLYPKVKAAAPKLYAVFSSKEHIGKTNTVRKMDRASATSYLFIFLNNC